MSPPLDPVLDPRLEPYVAAVHEYDVRYPSPGVHRGLPSTSLTLVLALDEPLDSCLAGVPGSSGRRWATVAGLHARPAEIRHRGHQAGIQLALTLRGARALLGLPASVLSQQVLELAEAAPALADLPERLAETPGRTRLDVVQQALVRALARARPEAPRAEVGHALALLTRGAGVQDVAREVGYSRRRLGTLVREESGLPPKQLQRVARFDRSRLLLAAGARAGRPDLAGVAARTGYADQSHLTREWTALAGCPPSVWLREEFPFVQDTPWSAGGG